MIDLRPYQDTWITGLRSAFASGEWSVLGVLPTGGGKTVCFSYLTWRLVSKGKRVIIGAHREELTDQISRTLARFNVRHGMVTAGALYDRRLLAHVASIATLARRLDRIEVPDYFIVDEAHHAILASLYGKIIAYWRERNPNLRVIGVTATPERLSGEGLGETFGALVLGPTPRELIDMGALSPYRLFGPTHALDLSGIKVRGGDYAKDGLDEMMVAKQIVGDTVSEYRKYLNGAPTVSFEVSIKAAEVMAEKFRAEGFTAASIDGKMDKKERRSRVHDFGRGALNLLTSCDIVSEGFDVPGIIGCISRRPTMSLTLDMQQKGRGLRTADGKVEAIFLDQVGNYLRHGLPDDPREWSLIGRERGKKKSDEENVACRQCPACYAVSPAAAVKCRECGKPFPVKARKIEEVAGTLSEVEVARARRQAARDQAAAQTLEDLIRLGTARGMNNPAGWAKHVYAAREAKRAGGGR